MPATENFWSTQKVFIGVGKGLMRLTSMRGAWHRCERRRRRKTKCSSSSSQSWKSYYLRWPSRLQVCFQGLGEPTGKDHRGWKGQGRLLCSVMREPSEQRLDCPARSSMPWWRCLARQSAIGRLAGRCLQGRLNCFCLWLLLRLGGIVLPRIQ